MANFNPQEKERVIRKLWQEELTYKFDEKSLCPIYSIDTPPPTISGSLHIGHIFSYTQTDVIARYKRLKGFNVLYPFGFDDNGLPTERFVEKKRGVSVNTLGREAFIAICLEETKEARETFTNLWKMIGLSVDWKKCYSTISEETQKISQKYFIELYKKGYIYKKKEPALYCTGCKTSVAQAELESVEKETLFVTILFKTDLDENILVATTRPELLSSCVAVLFHPEDTRYKYLKNKKLKVPIFNFYVPVLSDEKVIMNKGTGIVMSCTFGDTLDVYWFKKYNFTYRESIGLNGRMTEEAGALKGLSVEEGRIKIISLLEESSLLVEKKKIIHNVSIYERSKKEIEYVMLDQWFLNIMDHKKILLDAVEEIHWYPEHMKNRCINWIKNLEWDWCLSRQRAFGIPFPVWYKKDGSIVFADISDLPLDPQLSQPKGYEELLIPDTDIMDTWNTSSLTPFIIESLLKNKSEFIPMSLRPQAHDIIRTWAFYTIAKVAMSRNNIPWRDIVVSGHVVSSSKEKISKSVGNNPTDPLELLKKYPADVIRYWAASATLGMDTVFSDTEFKNGNRLLIKLYNAGEFIKSHLSKNIDSKEMRVVSMEVNRWIIYELELLVEKYERCFDEYSYSLGLSVAENFFFNTFCDNYIELIKHILFNPLEYPSRDFLEVRNTLSYVYKEILKLFSPIFAYASEYLFRDIFESNEFLSKSIINEKLNIIEEFKESKNIMEVAISLINRVRKIKSDNKLSLKSEIENLCISTSKDKIDSIKKIEILIKGILHANKIFYENGNELISLTENFIIKLVVIL